MVLLFVLLALEAAKQPLIKQQLVAAINAVNGNVNAAAGASPAPALGTSGAPYTLKQVAYWSIGAVALVALAAPAPDMATLFVITLMALVVFSDINVYTALLTPPPKKKA